MEGKLDDPSSGALSRYVVAAVHPRVLPAWQRGRTRQWLARHRRYLRDAREAIDEECTPRSLGGGQQPSAVGSNGARNSAKSSGEGVGMAGSEGAVGTDVAADDWAEEIANRSGEGTEGNRSGE